MNRVEGTPGRRASRCVGLFAFPARPRSPHSLLLLRRLSVAGLLLVFNFALPFGCVRAEPIHSLQRIGRAQGLPQSSVRSIAIDGRGFVWVGAETGISRYDGYRFHSVMPPFGNGVVLRVFIDGRDRVWTRWYGKPLTIYDPEQDRWEVVVGGEAIGAIGGNFEDASGAVWITSDRALLRYDAAAHRLEHVTALAPEIAFRYEQEFAEQFAEYRGHLWIRAGGEVVEVDGAARRVIRRMQGPGRSAVRLWARGNALWLCDETGLHRLAADGAHWITMHAVSDAKVTSCEISRDGAWWLGTDSAGAIRMSQGREQRFRTGSTPSSLAADLVSSVREDSRGVIWVVTPGVAHRWTGNGLERFRYSPDSQPSNVGGIAAAAWVEDANGVLWLGSESGGLAKISPFASKALHLVPPSTINAHVRTPVVEPDGTVWMGTNQDGVFRWRASDRTWTHFPAAPDDRGGLPAPEVRALLRTRDGTIWAGVQGGGVLARFDATTQRWQRHRIGLDALTFTLAELPNGSLLAGRIGFVTQFDPRTGRSLHFPTPGAAPVRATVVSRSGSVYVGMHQAGVHEFEPGRGFTRTWAKSLSDPNVFSLHEDRFGRLWIGTWGGGLDRLDPATGNVQVIARAEGLRDATVFGILPGRRDDLWLSTYAGLAHVRNCVTATWPCNPTVESFDAHDGLPIDEFDSEAAALGPDGVLYFGGYEGLIRLDPDSFARNLRPPRLQISAIHRNDDRLSPASWRTRAEGGVERNELRLPNGYGALRIQFSALDLNASGSSVYRYRLDPGRDWLSLGNRTELVLNDLGSGEHRLEIAGTNGDGVWGTESLSLALRVAAPWYRMPLAWVAYALLLAVGVYAVIELRQRRVRAINAHLEATVAERTRELAAANQARDEFYANVSHEIRTPLTLLVGTAEALRASDTATAREALADDLLRHGDSLRRYVESLITASHLQSSSNVDWMREDVARYLRNAVADFARPAGATVLRVEAAHEPCFVKSFPNALDTIFRNLLINAIRYTPAGGAITVRVTDGPAGVAVAIEDSGPGIDANLMPHLFERGARSGAPSDGGYGIGLHLVSRTLQSLGGAIEARNRPGGGACFTVTLPHAEAGLPVFVRETRDEAIGRPTAPTAAGPATAVVAESGATRDTAPTKGSRGRVLVVEDHDELRAYLERTFAALYRVQSAPTIAAGLEIARAQLPDLVVCDVLLPDGEGFDLVGALKSDPLTEHVGVIMLTALADEASRLRGLSAQADLYVTKPFLPAELLLQTHNLLEQRRRLRRAAARELWRDRVAGAAAEPGRKAGFEVRLMGVLEARHADPSCDVDAIARALALSRKQLERKTRFSFRCAPRALLTRYRLDKAAALLAQGVRVGEVAERCGFANQSRFGVLFKARFGHVPSRHAANGQGSVPA